MKQRVTNAAFVLLGVALLLTVVALLVFPARAVTPAQRGMDLAHEIAELMRERGYAEDHPVILACQEWWQAEAEGNGHAQVFVTDEQKKAYPVAAAVWQRLREHGLSEPVTAGIMGNMMSECGGQTLDLDPYIYSGGFYGLCMFSLHYFPGVDGLGVAAQVDFLIDTLNNIKDGGGSVEAFLSLTDARAAARYFSDYYERPASWSEKRADNAEAALAYFGG